MIFGENECFFQIESNIIIVKNNKTIVLFCLFLGILTNCTKSKQDTAVEQTPLFKQYTVGNRNNSQESGSWWGENITKIVHKGGKAFTVVLDDVLSPRTAVLYEKKDNEEWVEGQSFVFSRIPNILIDLKGYVHVIGFEPFNYINDQFSGRLVDIKFNVQYTVSGAFTKSYITEDYRSAGLTLATASSVFCGAAIGNNGKILVAYNNSLKAGSIGINNSLAVRIFDGNSWTFESVASGMTSNYAYPFAFVSDSYYHVYAVEDDYDPYYLTAGLPYSNYCFRYGAVKHFQRPISGGAWTETTLLDFNETKTKKEIWDATLRIIDFHVDYSGTIHALIRYNTNAKPMCYHYTKKENESSWKSETILEAESQNKGLQWVKIWERNDHKLFYIVWISGSQLSLSPLNSNSLQTISDLQMDYKPTPFVSSYRGGSPLESNLYIVVYPGYKIKAISLDVFTAGL